MVQPRLQRRRERDKLYHSSLRSQRDDFVGSDTKCPSPGLAIPCEEVIDETEDLLHHCVLPHIVITLTLELP